MITLGVERLTTEYEITIACSKNSFRRNKSGLYVMSDYNKLITIPTPLLAG